MVRTVGVSVWSGLTKQIINEKTMQVFCNIIRQYFEDIFSNQSVSMSYFTYSFTVLLQLFLYNSKLYISVLLLYFIFNVLLLYLYSMFQTHFIFICFFTLLFLHPHTLSLYINLLMQIRSKWNANQMQILYLNILHTKYRRNGFYFILYFYIFYILSRILYTSIFTLLLLLLLLFQCLYLYSILSITFIFCIY